MTTTRNSMPRATLSRIARTIARGTTCLGLIVSSARLAADSQPTSVNAPSRADSMNGPSQPK
nr:hypothetical protein [Microbispora sp. GKU 823]